MSKDYQKSLNLYGVKLSDHLHGTHIHVNSHKDTEFKSRMSMFTFNYSTNVLDKPKNPSVHLLTVGEKLVKLDPFDFVKQTSRKKENSEFKLVLLRLKKLRERERKKETERERACVYECTYLSVCPYVLVSVLGCIRFCAWGIYINICICVCVCYGGCLFIGIQLHLVWLASYYTTLSAPVTVGILT